MADNKTNFSSADKGISIAGAKQAANRVNPKAMLAGMTKDVRRRWMIVGTLSVIGMSLLAAGVTSSTAPKPLTATPESPVIDTTPKGISNQSDWKAQTGAELVELKKELAQSKTAQSEILARLTALQKAQQAAPAAQAPAVPQTGLTIPEPPKPPQSLSLPPIPSGEKTTVTPAPVPVTSATPEPVKRSPARAFVPPQAKASAQSLETKVEEYVLNDKQGFLPAGSFADATLISGVEAFTGGTAQSQPQPLVIRLDSNAVLPNAANYQIKGCHVLASVWGDNSSERVFGRLATLTCVDMHDQMVLSEEVEGTLVDSDGKNGIRGQLVDRQGAKLARSLLAGFAQGVSTAFGAAQSTITSGALGTTSMLTGDSFKAAGYGGANTAAQQLAQFYMKQAEATMPVIAVDAGRRISVLFTKSKSLKFESTAPYRRSQKDKLSVEQVR